MPSGSALLTTTGGVEWGGCPQVAIPVLSQASSLALPAPVLPALPELLLHCLGVVHSLMHPVFHHHCPISLVPGILIKPTILKLMSFFASSQIFIYHMPCLIPTHETRVHCHKYKNLGDSFVRRNSISSAPEAWLVQECGPRIWQRLTLWRYPSYPMAEGRKVREQQVVLL